MAQINQYSKRENNLLKSKNMLSGMINKTALTPTNLEKYTYNPRYPWLDENNYKKLESKIDALGLTWAEKERAMDNAYPQILPMVNQEIENSDRRKYINEATYQAMQLRDTTQKLLARGKLTATEISQRLKERYDLDPTANDEDVFNDWINSIPNWEQLFANYINSGDRALFYEWWLEDNITANMEKSTENVVQWWIKGRIATASSNKKENWLPSNWELVNPIGYITELLDIGWQKLADKITVWKKEREDLLNKLNNLSQEDIDQYKQWYENSWYQWSLEDYIIDMNKTWWQDLVWADEELKWIAEPNVFKFFGNMPASTLRLITASFKNATNPLDSLMWLGKIVGTEEGRDALYNRYLTAEWWANAMNYDSVGTADEVLSVTNSLWNLLKKWWKRTGLSSVEKAGNTLSSIWSPFDVAVDRALYWWDITYWTKDNVKTTNTKWLYRTLDTLSDGSKVLWAINRYAQDTSSPSKLLENTVSDVQALRKKANDWANNIIQNNNRMTKKQQENFKKMSWEDQGKWMNDRNLRTQEDLVNYFLESKNKVDDAMAAIEWQFTSKELTNVLDDAVDFAKKTENKQTSRLQELQNKNANWWLTMTEINEVKRFYEQNNKFNYLKEWTAEKSALATNRDTALREWQQKTAADNGLDNLKELNKETQAAKYLADNATDWQSWIKWNNPISLTDWIVIAEGWLSPKSLEWFVSKKILTAPRFQDKLVDVLNYIGWHETKAPISANMSAINQKNQLKAHERAILAEELTKVKNEKEFNAWLEKAQYMAWPALPEKITQWWVVAWEWWFVTQNWPTVQDLGLGKITEINYPEMKTRVNNELKNMNVWERLLITELFEWEEVPTLIVKKSNWFDISDDVGTNFFIKNEQIWPDGFLWDTKIVSFENIWKMK